MVFRTPADPSSALQRSRSSYHLEESRVEDDSSKELPWRQDIQEMLGSMLDTSFNRLVLQRVRVLEKVVF